MDVSRFFRIIGICFVTALIFYLAYLFKIVLIPFLVGYIFHFTLKPIVTFLERKGVYHTAAVTIVFTAAFGLLIGFFILFIPAFITEILNIQGNIPIYREALIEKIGLFQTYLLQKIPYIAQTMMKNGYGIQDQMSSFLSGYSFKFFKNLPTYLMSFVTIIMTILVIPFATFFFLLDEQRIKHKLIDLVPNRYFEVTLNMLYSLNRQFSWILKGMVISVAIISVLSAVCLWMIDLDFPIIVGIFAGIMNLIPYFGPIAGIAAAFLVAIMTNSPFSLFLYIILVFIFVQLIDNIFVQPLVLARSTNLHPLVVILLVLIGSQIGGMLGMLFIVPVASLIQVVAKVLYTEFSRSVRPAFSKFRDKDKQELSAEEIM